MCERESARGNQEEGEEGISVEGGNKCARGISKRESCKRESSQLIREGISVRRRESTLGEEGSALDLGEELMIGASTRYFQDIQDISDIFKKIWRSNIF